MCKDYSTHSTLIKVKGFEYRRFAKAICSGHLFFEGGWGDENDIKMDIVTHVVACSPSLFLTSYHTLVILATGSHLEGPTAIMVNVVSLGRTVPIPLRISVGHSLCPANRLRHMSSRQPTYRTLHHGVPGAAAFLSVTDCGSLDTRRDTQRSSAKSLLIAACQRKKHYTGHIYISCSNQGR